MLQFDHEKLDVYRLSLEFVVLADEIAGSLVDKKSGLGDQLRRASTSIVLNIAEGAGEFSKKARFYRMALRSSTECAAVIDICRKLNLFGEQPLLGGREILLRVVAMLIRLVKAIGPGGKKAGTGSGSGSGTRQGATTPVTRADGGWES